MPGCAAHACAASISWPAAWLTSRSASALPSTPRNALPEPAENEYYWSDLIGLSVFNAEQQAFGKVSELLETGANDVLVVQGERERLIPFVPQVIQEVDLAAGMIRVDWGLDY